MCSRTIKECEKWLLDISRQIFLFLRPPTKCHENIFPRSIKQRTRNFWVCLEARDEVKLSFSKFTISLRFNTQKAFWFESRRMQVKNWRFFCFVKSPTSTSPSPLMTRFTAAATQFKINFHHHSSCQNQIYIFYVDFSVESLRPLLADERNVF